MKNVFKILLGILILGCVSCNNGKTGSGKKIDTIWNEHVQDNFFGISFGVDRNSTIENLENKGFFYVKETSTDNLLHFIPNQGYFYSFGGKNWQMLNINCINNNFDVIEFMNAHTDKASALSFYEGVRNQLLSKYKETQIQNSDTTIYALTAIWGKNANVLLRCFRYESITHNMLIGVSLIYVRRMKKNANNEL